MLRKTIVALIAVAGICLGSATGALAFGGGRGGHGGGFGGKGFHGGHGFRDGGFSGRGYGGGFRRHGGYYNGHGYGYPDGYYGEYGAPYPYASSSYYSEDNVGGCYMRTLTPYGWRVRRAHVCN
jgi:hypothetical protein